MRQTTDRLATDLHPRAEMTMHKGRFVDGDGVQISVWSRKPNTCTGPRSALYAG